MGDIRFQDDGSSVVNGITVNTPYENDKANQSLTMADFLQLMIAEMKNQDFMGSDGGGSSQSNSAANYVTQMAQMSTMQQMEQLAYYSKTNYAMSLVGKQVTVATLGLGGNVKKEVGTVQKVTLDNDDYLVYVKGKGYKLSEIMNVGVPGAEDSEAFDALKNVSPLVTSRGSDNITVRWDPPKTAASEEKTVVYKVYVSENKDLAPGKNADVDDIIAKSEYIGSTEKEELEKRYYMDIDNLEEGHTYYVHVVAVSQSDVDYPYKTLEVKM